MDILNRKSIFFERFFLAFSYAFIIFLAYLMVIPVYMKIYYNDVNMDTLQIKNDLIIAKLPYASKSQINKEISDIKSKKNDIKLKLDHINELSSQTKWIVAPLISLYTGNATEKLIKSELLNYALYFLPLIVLFSLSFLFKNGRYYYFPLDPEKSLKQRKR